MSTDKTYLPPESLDFPISPAMREAARITIPPAVYDKYRERVVNEVFTEGRGSLKAFLRELSKNPRFMAAYFHPTYEALRDTTGPFPPTPQAIKSAQLDDRPFRLAVDVARRASQAYAFSNEDRALASVLAFVYASGLLFNVSVVNSIGIELSKFTRSRFCHDHCRYLRSIYTHEPLKVLFSWERGYAFLLGYALDERSGFRSQIQKNHDRAALLSSVLAWSQPLLHAGLAEATASGR